MPNLYLPEKWILNENADEVLEDDIKPTPGSTPL